MAVYWRGDAADSIADAARKGSLPDPEQARDLQALYAASQAILERGGLSVADMHLRMECSRRASRAIMAAAVAAGVDTDRLFAQTRHGESAVWAELCERLTAAPASGKPGQITVDIEGCTALFRGQTFHLLNRRQAEVLDAIVAAGGDWASGAELKKHENDRIDRRYIHTLPVEIQAQIESKTGSGYRLKMA